MAEQDSYLDKARNVIYKSFEAFAVGDQDLDPCNMCVSQTGSFLLNCAQQNPQHGVLMVIKDEEIEVEVLGESIVIEEDSSMSARFYSYFPQLITIGRVVEIVPKAFCIKDKSGKEKKIADLNLKNMFAGEIEERMTTHMNEDHIDAMKAYCSYTGISYGKSDPVMLGVDQYGFDLLVDWQPVRFTFKTECKNPQQVREALVELAQESRKTNAA